MKFGHRLHQALGPNYVGTHCAHCFKWFYIAYRYCLYKLLCNPPLYFRASIWSNQVVSIVIGCSVRCWDLATALRGFIPYMHAHGRMSQNRAIHPNINDHKCITISL